MPTLNQLSVKKRRKKKRRRKKRNSSCPQRKAICLKVFEKKPKKPNSARRNVCKVRFTGFNIKKKKKEEGIVFIPGEKHNIEEYSRILVRGGKTQDLPGVKYKAIRGKFDLLPVVSRTHKRSKYGCPSF